MIKEEYQPISLNERRGTAQEGDALREFQR